MSGSKKWIVTSAGDSPLNELKKQLIEKGFTVEQVMNEIGIITGTAEEDVVEKIKKVPGVADISPDTDINIGNPDSPVTW
jgi:hypothetical protein